MTRESILEPGAIFFLDTPGFPFYFLKYAWIVPELPSYMAIIITGFVNIITFIPLSNPGYTQKALCNLMKRGRFVNA